MNTNIKFKAIGRVVCINGICNPGPNKGINISVGWIPDAGNSYGIYERFKPINDIWLSCDYYNESSFDGMPEAHITLNGIIMVSIYAINHDLKIGGVYICKG
jgi:hypothetical protein